MLAMAISIPGNSGLQYWGIPVCNFEDSYFALNTGMQIDAAVELMLFGVKSHRLPPSLDMYP